MKKLLSKLPYILIGVALAIAGGVAIAANVTIPASTQQGQVPMGTTNGNYTNGKLVQGSNVTINTSTPGQITISATGGSGSGVPSTTPFTSGYIPYATSTLALTNSNIFQLGSNVGIGTTSPSQKLQVNGSALLGVGNTTSGTLLFANSSNAYTTTLQASTTQASNLTFTLPPTNGSAGQVLSTDGNGVMSWINASSSSSGLASYNVVSANGLISVATSTTLATLTASTSPTFTNLYVSGNTNLATTTITSTATNTPIFSIKATNGTTDFEIRDPGAGSTYNGNAYAGLQAGMSGSGYTGNTAFGYLALKNNTQSWETAFGNGALGVNTTGEFNTSVGDYALGSNTTGGWNTAVGESALYNNVTTNYATAIGNDAMYNNASSSNDTAVGAYAGRGAIGNYNSNNSLFGYNSGYAITTGNNNTFLGVSSGYTLTSGSDNTFLGNNAGELTTGTANIAIGDGSDVSSASGNGQMNIGNLLFATGLTDNAGGDVTTAENGRFGVGSTTPIGKLVIVPNATTDYAIPVLVVASSSGASDLIILANGNVGIGTTSPANLLDVNGNADVQGALSIGTSTTPTVPLYIVNNNQAGLRIQRTSGTAGEYEWYIDNNGALNYYDDLAHANRLMINTSGYVTAGVSSLAAQFGVLNSTSTIPGILVKAASAQSMDLLQFASSTGSTEGMSVSSNGTLKVGTQTSNTVYNGSNGVASIIGTNGYWGIRTDTSDNFNLDMYNSEAPIAAMTVQQNGNVGIGTTSPTAPLSVYQSTNNAALTTLVNQSVYSPSSGYTDTFQTQVGANSNRGGSLVFGETGGAFNARQEGIDFGLNQVQFFQLGNYPISFHTNASESGGYVSSAPQMIILGNGNVGIGTTSPNQKLQVNGSALLGVGNTTSGTLLFANSANAYTTTLQASSSQASNLTFTFPPNSGSAGQVLSTDGNGVMSWINASSSSSGLASYNVVSANGLISVATSTTLATLTASTSPTFTNGQFTGTLGVTGQTTLANSSTTVGTFGTLFNTAGQTTLFNASTTVETDGALFVTGQTTLGNASSTSETTTNFYLTGATTGCATFTGTLLSSTGTACGSGGGGSSQWTIGNGFIRNATSTDAVEIGNGSSTPIAGSLVLSSAGTTTPSFTLLNESGLPAIEMRDGGYNLKNTLIGVNAGGQYSGSNSNQSVILGNNAGQYLTTSDGNNVLIGYTAGQSTNGNGSGMTGLTFVGSQAGSGAVSAQYDVYMGTYAGQLAKGGYNVIIGYNAATNTSNTNSHNIFIGNGVAQNETGGNILEIDGATNNGRSNITQEHQNAIIYGIMNTASTSQAITFNVATATVTGLLQQGFEKSCSTGLTTDASGNINGCVVSDQRLKKNILDLSFNPDILSEISPVTYYWKNTAQGTSQHAGFVAQAVKPYLPQAVVSAGDGYYGIDPNAMIAYLWKFLQIFVKQTDDFMTSTALRFNKDEATIQKQQTEINNLQRQVNLLLQEQAKGK